MKSGWGKMTFSNEKLVDAMQDTTDWLKEHYGTGKIVELTMNVHYDSGGYTWIIEVFYWRNPS